MPKNLYERNGWFWARFKIAGKEHRLPLRIRVGSKAAERRAEDRMIAEREKLEAEARFGERGPVTWPEAVVAWNDTIGSSIAASTFRRYLVSLNSLRSHLDGLSVHEIDAARLKTITKARQRAGVTNATIRRDLTAISSVLANADDEGWIEGNAAASLSRKRLPEKRDPIVLPEDASIAAMVAASPARFGDMIEFARETGMRETEIALLEWQMLDLSRRVATLHRTKGNKVRAVPLSAKAVEIINRQPQLLGTKIVFRHEDGGHYVSPSSKFGAVARRVAQKNAAFVRFRFHDLRHLFAVEYLRNGHGSIYSLQGIMGHSSIKTTELYLEFFTPEQAQAIREGVAQKVALDQRSGGAA